MSELKVVLFVSRNKDNKHISDFKERRVSFLTDKLIGELNKDFDEFVKRGLPNEMCRFYQQVNKRDNNKIRKSLIHELVDNENLNMSKLDSKIASISSKKENRSESKWLFDFDEDKRLIGSFLKDVKSYLPKDKTVIPLETPNGYSVVVEQGFDTRELLDKWKNVELKRDDMVCLDWKENKK